MPSGGARARAGPPPDPNALRRDRPSDAEGWVTLDRNGRTGPPPEWPLDEQTDRESTFWKREWSRPQAIVWEANGQVLEVAVFVRSLAAAEKPDASVPSRTLVRQQMDALGITVPGLRANRWKIGDAATPQRATGTEGRGAGPAARSRLRSVKGGQPS